MNRKPSPSISRRSFNFQEWLREQPPSVVTPILKAERAYTQSLAYRIPAQAVLDSLEGWTETETEES